MKKKVDPAISEHFRELSKESWKKRRKKILEKAKVAASPPKSGN
jgi:hypothetical protein